MKRIMYKINHSGHSESPQWKLKQAQRSPIQHDFRARNQSVGRISYEANDLNTTRKYCGGFTDSDCKNCLCTRDIFSALNDIVEKSRIPAR